MSDQSTLSSSAYDTAVQQATSAYDEEGNLVTLQEQHLVALLHNPTILNQLKSVELQKLIRVILNSKTRLDALDAGLNNIPEFHAFCCEVLATIHKA